LLLNHLGVYNNCEIIFDSRDALDSADADRNVNTLCNVSELQRRILTVTHDISQMEICPTFVNFEFHDPNTITDVSSELEFDPFTDDDVPELPNYLINEDGVDPQQKEASLLQELLEQENDEQEPKPPDIPFLIAESEFVCGDLNVLENWAGPNHWKFRPITTEPKKKGKDKEKKKDTKKRSIIH